MKTLYYLTAMSMLLMLGSVPVSFGQGTPQPMYSSAIATDTQCQWDGNICDSVTSACTSVSVVVESSGNYKIQAWVECVLPANPCGGCFACAHLLRASDNHDMGRAQSPCQSPCSQTQDLFEQLQAGVQYTLYVCKKPCNLSNCASCETECIAKAQIHG